MLPMFQTTGNPAFFADEVERLAAHPAMPAAFRSYAANFTAHLENRPLLNLIVSDRGRVLMAWMALYFDAGYDPAVAGSGLTVNRFKTACHDSGLCSRGRAAAMLGIMRFAGHIEPAHQMRKGYPLRLIPTEKLRATFRHRIESAFRAMAHMLPEAATGLHHLGNPDFERAFVKSTCDGFLAGPRPITFAPAMEPLAEAKAGFAILLALVASATSQGVPTDEPLSVPLSRLSDRYAVSRAQAKELLLTAERHRLLLPAGGETRAYYLSDDLRRGMFLMLAAFFLLAVRGIRDGAAAALPASMERMAET